MHDSLSRNGSRESLWDSPCCEIQICTLATFDQMGAWALTASRAVARMDWRMTELVLGFCHPSHTLTSSAPHTTW